MQDVLHGISSVLSSLNITFSLKQDGNRVLFKSKKSILASARKASKKELKHFGIKQDVFLGFIEWDSVMTYKKEGILYSHVSKFPEVTRDLSILIDEKVKFVELESHAFQVARKLLKKVILFDVYEGNKLEKGKKSYAIKFILSDPTRTLDDKTIDHTMNKIIAAYKKQFNAELR